MASSAGPSGLKRFYLPPPRTAADPHRLLLYTIQDGMLCLIPSEDDAEIREEEATLEAAAARMKAKSKARVRARATRQTDAEFALQLYREEREAAARVASDHALAIALANNSDEEIPISRGAMIRTPTPPRRNDERRSRSLHNDNQAPTGSRPTSRERRMDDTIGRPSRRNQHRRVMILEGKTYIPDTDSFYGASGITAVNGTSSGSQFKNAIAMKKPKRFTGHDCVVCQDPIRVTEVRAPCGHYYDTTCLLDLFTASTRDETLFPPSCCHLRIPLSLVKHLMTADALQLFAQRAQELTTPNRVYCCNPKCSRFLGPQSNDRPLHILRCPAEGCDTSTCARCKAIATPEHKCKPLKADKAVLALAERAGWARCPGCAQLVELNTGCYHMTCRCKTQFCYLCSAMWKSCNCPQWTEDGLLGQAGRALAAPARRGNLRADRAPDNELNPDDPEENHRRLLVQLAIEELRQDGYGNEVEAPECVHWQWNIRWGGGTCERCRQSSFLFLWKCRSCAAVACARCRRMSGLVGLQFHD